MNARRYATNAFKVAVITTALGLFFPSCSSLWSRHKGEQPVAKLPVASTNGSAHLASDRLAQNNGTTAPAITEAQPQPTSPAAAPTLPTTPGNRTLPIQGKLSYPVAKTVPGRDGFVYSPFDQQRVIDVTEFRSGQLVADPTYPLSDKKFFRVP